VPYPIRKRMLVLVAFGFLAGITLAGWFVLQDGLVWIVGGLSTLLLGVGFILYARQAEEISQIGATQEGLCRRIEDFHRGIDSYYGQLQILLWLTSVLKVRLPLSPLGGFPIEPDLAALIFRTVREKKPRLIVELGSGVSTVLIGYVLEEQGGGRLVSFDDNEWYRRQTERDIRSHGLGNVVEVRLAPLKEVSFSDRTWLWYDPGAFSDLRDIDLLIIDGPPGGYQNLSRYPALPVLFDSLAKGALVILDDSKRPDEQKILDLWASEFPSCELESVDTLNGAAILKKR
jgi:predicted O-methyltransferase YrrM